MCAVEGRGTACEGFVELRFVGSWVLALRETGLVRSIIFGVDGCACGRLVRKDGREDGRKEGRKDRAETAGLRRDGLRREGLHVR